MGRLEKCFINFKSEFKIYNFRLNIPRDVELAKLNQKNPKKFKNIQFCAWRVDKKKVSGQKFYFFMFSIKIFET